MVKKKSFLIRGSCFVCPAQALLSRKCSWAATVTYDSWDINTQKSNVKFQRHILAWGCFPWVSAALFSRWTSERQHWSLIIRLTAQWNGPTTANEGAVMKICFTEQRLNTAARSQGHGNRGSTTLFPVTWKRKILPYHTVVQMVLLLYFEYLMGTIKRDTYRNGKSPKTAHSSYSRCEAPEIEITKNASISFTWVLAWMFHSLILSELLTVLYAQDDVSEVQPRLLFWQRIVCGHFHHWTENHAGSQKNRRTEWGRQIHRSVVSLLVQDFDSQCEDIQTSKQT